jgi:hypothetical protein
MKKENNALEKKIFRFKFNTATLIFIILGIRLCIAGIGTSVFRIIKEAPNGITEILQSPLLIDVCLFGLVVLLSMLIRSRYEIDEKNLTLRFGIIKSQTPINIITAIEMDKDDNKLSIFVGESYSVVLVNKEWNESFVAALQEINPKIEYSLVMAKTKPKKED